MSDAVVRGVVHLIEETKTYGQKGFRKRLIVLEQDNGRFTNYIPVEFVQDNCEKADGMNEGDELEVRYRLNGRKWQDKWFLNAEALDFEVLGQKSAAVGADSASDTEDYIPTTMCPSSGTQHFCLRFALNISGNRETGDSGMRVLCPSPLVFRQSDE